MAANDPILLDTHILVWLVGEPENLDPSVIPEIERAISKGCGLVSTISFWEIAMLVGKHRLILGEPTKQWVTRVLRDSGLTLAPITPEIAVDSNELPLGLTGDPADRILVATARAEGATLATRDKLILDYARQGHVKVLAA